MIFSNQMIADAIREFYPDCKISEKIEELLKSSRWLKASPLFDVCKIILPPSSNDRTVQAHINKFWSRLRNNKEIIKRLILDANSGKKNFLIYNFYEQKN